MAQIDSTQAFQQLITHWSNQGLEVSQGASARDIADFETLNNVLLPSDFGEYLLNVNGMIPKGGEDCDEKGFAFWPLEDIKRVPVECSTKSLGIPDIHGISDYFVFADYMQWSWAYAIRLSEGNPGNILQFGIRKPRVIAENFSDFVRLYVSDSDQIYDPN